MKDYIVEENIDLKKYNTYGIGGTAKYLIKPRNIAELKDILKMLNSKNIPIYILGGGSNVILPDNDFYGAIIKLDYLNTFFETDNFIYAGSGLNLNKFIDKTLDLGYISLANLYGIPGALGGAIVGNAGCNGVNIFDFVESVLVLDNEKVILKKKQDILYSYRNTEFKNSNQIILGARFKLVKGNVDCAKKEIKNNLEKRKSTQPLGTKNAGSVFKNPMGFSAGKLIDEVGLKEYCINDAMVSKKHANFIINLKKATSNDIIELVEVIRKKVYEKKGINLELEQVIVKW